MPQNLSPPAIAIFAASMLALSYYSLCGESLAEVGVSVSDSYLTWAIILAAGAASGAALLRIVGGFIGIQRATWARCILLSSVFYLLQNLAQITVGDSAAVKIIFSLVAWGVVYWVMQISVGKTFIYVIAMIVVATVTILVMRYLMSIAIISALSCNILKWL